MMARTVSDQETYKNWRYLAVRPQTIPAAYPGHADLVYADCSDGCRMIARWSGVAEDPAGNAYGPWGNSSSIWAHLTHIALADALPGDIVTFGFSTGEHHAAMLWAKGDGDWYVWNHGAPGQPVKSTLSAEKTGHAGMTVTVCRLPVADPPPTPQDELRAMTGFYAWVAWRLGEGPFKPFGKANPNVRPAVPKLIPVSWWKMLAAFLLARKKPTT